MTRPAGPSGSSGSHGTRRASWEPEGGRISYELPESRQTRVVGERVVISTGVLLQRGARARRSRVADCLTLV